MFARTERLTLRPAWPEDAPALTAAIGHEQVARMLAHVPYPYTPADAVHWIGTPRGAHEPRFVIEAHDNARPRLIGGIAIIDEAGGPEIGYWLTPTAWGRGYATEAGRAVVEMARHALPLRRLGGRHFADNPASGRVLRKLGFRPTGVTGTLHSRARRVRTQRRVRARFGYERSTNTDGGVKTDERGRIGEGRFALSPPIPRVSSPDRQSRRAIPRSCASGSSTWSPAS